MRQALFIGLVFLLGCGDGDEGAPGSSSAPQAPGADPFDDNVLASYHVTMAQSDWDAIVADPFDNTQRHASVEWQGETYLNVAVEPAGNRSRIAGNPKPSVRIKFDEFVPDREFHHYSSLKFDAMIHDVTMMRARLEYPVYRALGVPSPNYVHCRFYVNGVYKGLYGVEERLKKEFVRKRFGLPVRQLYSWTASDLNDLVWVGPDPVTKYVPYMWMPEVDELPPDAEGVRDLCDALNNDLARFPSIFDVPSFLRFIAAETLLGEGDEYVADFTGSRSANMRLYRPPTTNKYMLLPWDTDQGFWRQETGITFAFENRLLTRKLILENSANFNEYKQDLKDLLAGPYETFRVHARMEFIRTQIRPAVYEDTLKPFSNADFENAVTWIKAYVTNRNQAFSAQLAP
jgi:spore coat protein CotH